jgi:hypothetical protein
MMKYLLIALLTLTLLSVHVNAQCTLTAVRSAGTFTGSNSEWHVGDNKKAYYELSISGPNADYDNSALFSWNTDPSTSGLTATFSNPNGMGVLILDIDSGSSPVCPTFSSDLTFSTGLGVQCTVNIAIAAQGNPQIVGAPAPQSYECDDVPPPAQLGATSGNSYWPSVVYTESITSGTVLSGNYVMERKWTATDSCSFTSVHTQAVTVSDTTPPTITHNSQNGTYECDDIPVAADCNIVVDDNCDASPVISHVDTTSTGGCGQNYTITRTWTATDAAGRTSTEADTLEIRDTVAPVITASPNVDNSIFTCASEFYQQSDIVVAATDNCGPNPVVTTTPSSGTASCGETLTFLYTTTDDCGHPASLSMTQTSNDVSTPVFVGIPIEDGHSSIDCSQADIIDDCGVYAVHACDGEVAVSYTVSQTEPNTYCNNHITRSWSTTDSCGQTVVEYVVTTVSDTTDPEITIYSNGVLAAGQEYFFECGTSVNVVAEATDNCHNVTLTHVDTPLDCGNFAYPNCVNVTSRSYTASDSCGKTANRVLIIVELDTLEPVWITDVPSAVTKSCEFGFADPPLPYASDLCDGGLITATASDSVDSNCTHASVTTYTYTATDNIGNTLTSVSIVTIEDNEGPVLCSTPANASVECDDDAGRNQSSYEPTFKDNCDTDLVLAPTSTRVNGTCIDEYELHMDWTTSDECGNPSVGDASMIVSVTDTKAPSIYTKQLSNVNCNSSVHLSVEAERESLFGADLKAAVVFNATDNCATATVTIDTSSNASCADYAGSVSYFATATDDCGHTAQSDIKSFSVVDTAAPVFSPLVLTADPVEYCTQDTTNNSVLFGYSSINISATDDCDTNLNPTFKQRNNMSDGCLPHHDDIWTVSDACGKTSTNTVQVRFVDTTKPTFDNAPVGANYTCLTLTEINTYLASDTWSGTDCGKTIPATQKSCNFYNLSTHSMCEDEWIYMCEYEVCDCSNNCASKNVTFERILTPVVWGSLTDKEDNCTLPSFDTPTATHACGLTVTMWNLTSDGNYHNPLNGTYHQERNWGGYAANCLQFIKGVAMQSVYQYDSVKPNITLDTTPLVWPCDNWGSFPVAQITDNCGLSSCGDDPTISFTSNDTTLCGGNYEMVRKYVATDCTGNTEEAFVNISITDLNAPTFQGLPPAYQSVNCTTVTAANVTAMDDCEGAINVTTTTSSHTESSDGTFYNYTITYEAIDDCGNKTDFVENIQVYYPVNITLINTPPAIIHVDCNDTIPAETDYDIQAIDDCVHPIITMSDANPVYGCNPHIFNISRTWTAVDNLGHVTATFTQLIVVDKTYVEGSNSFTWNTPTKPTTPYAWNIDGDYPHDDIVVPDGEHPCAGVPNVCDAPETTPFGTCQSFVYSLDCMATMECGGTQQYGFTVSIEEDTYPVITDTSNEVNISVQCYEDLTAYTLANQRANGVDFTLTMHQEATDAEITGYDTSTYGSWDNEGDYQATASTRNNGYLSTTYTFTDCDDDTDSITYTMYVNDTTDPDVNLTLASYIHECGEDLDFVPTPSHDDNCLGQTLGEYTFSNTTAIKDMDGGNVTVSVTVTDKAGNTDTATAVIMIVDTVPPVISVPVDSYDNEYFAPGTIPSIDVTADDNCTTPVVTNYSNVTNDGCPYNYTTTWWYTATDEEGLTDTDTYSYSFVDSTPPVLSTHYSGVAADCYRVGFVPSLDTVTASDVATGDSPNVTYSFDVVDTGSTPYLNNNCAFAHENSTYFVISHSWNSTDLCGNTVEAEYHQIVYDFNVTCNIPGPFYLDCGDIVTAIILEDLEFDDGCTNGSETIVEGNSWFNTGTCEDEYEVHRIFDVVDALGNTVFSIAPNAVSGQNVTYFVTDGSAPTVLAPACATNALGTCEYVADENCSFTEDPAVVADNCDSNLTVVYEKIAMNTTHPNQVERYTRKVTATDNCGQSTSETWIVVLKDTTPPTYDTAFNSELDFTTENCTITFPSPPSVSDNCDANPQVTHVNNSNAGAHGCEVTYSRAYSLTDSYGNSWSDANGGTVDFLYKWAYSPYHNFHVTITDDTYEFSDYCNVTEPNVTVHDDCGHEATIGTSGLWRYIENEDDTQDRTAELYVDYTVENDIGNTCTFGKVYWNETILKYPAPENHTLTYTPSSGECVQAAPAPVGDYDIGQYCELPTENTTTQTDYICTDGTNNPNTFYETATYTVTSHDGVPVTTYASFTSYDSTAPTIQVESNPSLLDLSSGSMNLYEDCALPTMPMFNWSDICDETSGSGSAVQESSENTHTGTAVVSNWTYVYSASDYCGNADSTNFTVVVRDTTPPVLTALNTTVYCDSSMDFSPPSATDCNNVTITYSNQANFTAVACNDAGVVYQTSRTVTATDEYGNTVSATQVINHAVNAAPIAAFVPSMSFPTTSFVYNITDASETCDIPVVPEFCAHDCYNNSLTGSMVRTGTNFSYSWSYHANDSCGTSSNTVVANATLDDQVDPWFAVAPANLTAYCNETFSPRVLTCEDNCGNCSSTAHTQVPVANCHDTFMAGASSSSTKHDWILTDSQGNTEQYSAYSYYVDNTAPYFNNFPSNDIVESDNCSFPAVDFGNMTAEDDCHDDSLNYTYTSFVTATNDFNSTKEYCVSTTDSCGNPHVECFEITIIDNNDVNVTNDVPSHTAECQTPVPPVPTATHPCFVVTSTNTTNTTYSCTDGDDRVAIIVMETTFTAGGKNYGPYTTTGYSTDTVAPNVTISVDGVVTDNATLTQDNCGNDAVITASSVDACWGDPEIVEDIDTTELGLSSPLLQVRVHNFTATDDCGHSSWESITVTTEDTDEPAFDWGGCTANDTTRECNDTIPCVPTVIDCVPDWTINVTAANYTLTTTPQTTSCDYLIVTQYDYTATDHVGKTTTHSYTTTSEDTTPPNFVGGLTTNNSIGYDCDAVLPTVTAYDDCEVNFVSVDSECNRTNTTGNDYYMTCTHTASDACGNTNEVVTIHHGQDHQSPVVTTNLTNNAFDIEDWDGVTQPTVDDAECTDDCGPCNISLAATYNAGGCPHNFTVTYTWTSYDESERNAPHTVSITYTVTDSEPPVIHGVTETTSATATVYDISNILTIPDILDGVWATDNSGTQITVTADETVISMAGQCDNNFQIKRVYTASDLCGWSDTATVYINITDTVPPTFNEYPTDITVECDAVPTPCVVYTLEDNFTVDMQTLVDNGTHLITLWEAVDDCGNEENHTQTITIEDTTAPIIVDAPTDTSEECACDNLPTPSIEAIDNCEEVNVTHSATTSVPNPTKPNDYIITNTWIAFTSDHSVTHTQTQTVTDTTAPVLEFDGPTQALTILSCADDHPAAVGVHAYDVCDGSLNVSTSTQTTSTSCADQYTFDNTYTASDDNGLSVTTTLSYNILDVVGPAPGNAFHNNLCVYPTKIVNEDKFAKIDNLLDLFDFQDNCDPAPAVSFVDCNSTMPSGGSDVDCELHANGNLYVRATKGAVYSVFASAVDRCGQSSMGNSKITITVPADGPSYVAHGQMCIEPEETSIPLVQ